MEKPKHVVVAVNLLWTTLAISAAKVLSTGFKMPSQHAGPLFLGIVVFFTMIIMMLLILQVAAGKNWARRTYAAFYVMGLISSVFLIQKLMQVPLTVIVFLIQSALQGYALFLLFTEPADAWFRRDGAVISSTDI